MKSLAKHFREIMERGIHESRWFKTAPADAQASATIKIFGVDLIERAGVGGHRTLRPALIAECECGGEVQRFSLLIDSADSVETIG